MEKKDEEFVKCLSIVPNARSLKDIACIKSYLKTIEILKGYKDFTISEYARIARYELYQSNRIIYQDQSICTSWYIVLSGCVLVGQTMFLPRKSFGHRSTGSLHRFEECLTLEPTELIVFDYSLDRQINIMPKKTLMQPSLSVDINGHQGGSGLLVSPGNMTGWIKRCSHASDTSSIYSSGGCGDGLQSSSLASESDEDVDEDDLNDPYDDEDLPEVDEGVDNKTATAIESGSLSTVVVRNKSATISGKKCGTGSNNSRNNDVFYEALAKDPDQRTDEDVEILVAEVANMTAFAGLTERSRFELCRVMRVALAIQDSVEKTGEQEGIRLLEDGQLLETWNVLLDGVVELRLNTDQHSVHQYGRGYSFGVRRKPGCISNNSSPEPQYQCGDIYTVTPRCIFFCAFQQQYWDIVNRNNDSIIPETAADGHQVLVYEERGGANPPNRVIVKGTSDKLLHSLLFDRYKSDPMYTENFLLTYRVFLNSPAVLAAKLVDCYRAEPTDVDTKTKEAIRRCLILWANNHFADLDNPDSEMTEYLEKFEDIFAESSSDRDRLLFHRACSSNSKRRFVTLTCDRCQLKNHPIMLAGMQKEYGLFVKEINRAVVKNGWSLRKGDQILSLANLSWERLETLDKACETLNNKLVESVDVAVKYNPTEFHDLTEYISGCETGAEMEIQNSEMCAMLHKTLQANRRVTLVSGEGIRSMTVPNSRLNRRLSLNRSANWPVHMFGISSITPMVVPRPNEIGNCVVPTVTPIRSHKNTGNPNRSVDVPDQSSKTANPRSANASPNRHMHRQRTKPKQCYSPANKQAAFKPKTLNSRSSSNPNLKALEEESSSSSTMTGSNYDTNTTLFPTLSAPAAEASVAAQQALKVYQPNSQSSWKFVLITEATSVKEALPLVLKEFGTDLAEVGNYALYTVTVEANDTAQSGSAGSNSGQTPNVIVKSSRNAPHIRELAGRLGLNQRYYLRHNAADSQLITDEQSKMLFNESKISIYNLKAEEIATRLTHMDFCLFRAIRAEEYLNFTCKMPAIADKQNQKAGEQDRKEMGFSTGFENYTKFENLIDRESFWPTTEICREATVARRAELIKKFIKVAQMCRKLKNFNSAICIVTGLTLSPVERLKASWDKVPDKYKKIYNDLSSLINMTFNFQYIRNLQSPEVTEPPLIPCMAMHSRDLSVFDMGNKTHYKDGLINFEKMRMIAAEIRKLVQMCSSDYSLSSILHVHHSRLSQCQTAAGTNTPGAGSNNSSSAGILFNFMSTSPGPAPSHTQQHNTKSSNNNFLDESDATSGISGCSANSDPSGASTRKTNRSNSVDHSVSNISSFNGTLKKVGAKRKSLANAAAPGSNLVGSGQTSAGHCQELPNSRQPKKVYEEWLSTLRVRTYWTNVRVEMDIKRLQDMSRHLEPPANANSSNLSTSNESTVKATETPTPQPVPLQPSLSSSKPSSSVTINLSSPPTPKSALPDTLSQPSPAAASTQLRHPLSSEPSTKPGNRPQSIFNYQSPEDADKLKALVQSTQRTSRGRRHGVLGHAEQQQQQLQQQQYQNHYLRVRNPQLGSDSSLLTNYIPKYNKPQIQKDSQPSNYLAQRGTSSSQSSNIGYAPGGMSINVHVPQALHLQPRPAPVDDNNYLYPSVNLPVNNSYYGVPCNPNTVTTYVSPRAYNAYKKGSGPPAYESILNQRNKAVCRPMGPGSASSGSSSNVSTVPDNNTPHRPPPVPPSYTEHMMMSRNPQQLPPYHAHRHIPLPGLPQQQQQQQHRPANGRQAQPPPPPPPRNETLHTAARHQLPEDGEAAIFKLQAYDIPKSSQNNHQQHRHRLQQQQSRILQSQFSTVKEHDDIIHL